MAAEARRAASAGVTRQRAEAERRTRERHARTDGDPPARTGRDAEGPEPPAPATSIESFAVDVARALQRHPRQLQSHYLYDELGSRLFEAICRLPWYRITRAEERLLARHRADIAARCHGADGTAIVELGVGSGEKLASLIEAFPPGSTTDVHLIDVSAAALDATAARLSGVRGVRIVRHEGTYEQGLGDIGGSAAPRGRRLVLFLGSNIGNFDGTAARGFLQAVRRALGPGDLLLLGADLVKPPADLIVAYDDPLGVTAAFNRNLLVRINRELGADFDLDGFAHQARWNETASRIEMHLVSRVHQTVEIPAARLRVAFAPGETIWTESSYKYSEAGIVSVARAAGFEADAQWIDDQARFALTLFTTA